MRLVPPAIFPCHSRRAAFSLVEILVVAGIVALLCSIGMAGISSLQRRADQARCASNLRQIGAGIIMYANENDARLPGPTYGAQGSNDEIAVAITPYLGSTNATVTLFSCPAWLKNPGNSSGKKPFYTGKSVILTDGTTAYAFGYKRKAPDTSDLPVRLAAIKAPSEASALVDLDARLVKNSAAVSEPSHEKVRNTLFFDGHVQSVPVDLD